jgi:hypothetical protein
MTRLTDLVAQHNGVTDRALDESIETVPEPFAVWTLAAGAFAPVGMAFAAAITTCYTNSERVAVTAWVAVAVVGTASVISAAAVSRRRTKAVHRESAKAKD